jgi:hypothetical protein
MESVDENLESSYSDRAHNHESDHVQREATAVLGKPRTRSQSREPGHGTKRSAEMAGPSIYRGIQFTSRAMKPTMQNLIDALAERLVADYLTEKTASPSDSDEQRSNPAPLLPVDKAA